MQADCQYDPAFNAILIITWSSQNEGQGDSRRALEWLGKKFDQIIVQDPGQPGESSFQFWEHMFKSGLVTRVISDRDEVIFEGELPDEWNLHGGWIDEKGNFYEIDHANDVHHSDIALEHFGDYVEYDNDGNPDEYTADAAQGVAMSQGWIRVGAGGGSSLGVNWDQEVAPAWSTLLRWMKGKKFEIYYLNNRQVTRIQFLETITKNTLHEAHIETVLTEDVELPEGSYWIDSRGRIMPQTDHSHSDMLLDNFKKWKLNEHPDMVALYKKIMNPGPKGVDDHFQLNYAAIQNGWVRVGIEHNQNGTNLELRVEGNDQKVILRVIRDYVKRYPISEISAEQRGERGKVVNSFFLRADQIPLYTRTGRVPPQRQYESITEAFKNSPFPYWKNPTGTELIAALTKWHEIRGEITRENVYWWPAETFTHGEGNGELSKIGEIRPGEHRYFTFASDAAVCKADSSWSRMLKPVGPVWIAIQNNKLPTEIPANDAWSMLINRLLRIQKPILENRSERWITTWTVPGSKIVAGEMKHHEELAREIATQMGMDMRNEIDAFRRGWIRGGYFEGIIVDHIYMEFQEDTARKVDVNRTLQYLRRLFKKETGQDADSVYTPEGEILLRDFPTVIEHLR